MNKNQISIIVPIYNVEQYLDECIKSIQKQTYTNLEIILVDDGSTDNSGSICDRYAAEDARIVVIHQENRGLVSARKSGLMRATGTYIGFVDGDDYIKPEMYETLVCELIDSRADVVHTGYLDGEMEIVRFESGIVDLERDREGFVNDVLNMHQITPSIWSKLFKADVIKLCYSYVDDKSSYGEDLICLCAVALKASRICLLNRAFYHYRIRENSLSHDVNIDNIKKEIQLYNNVCEVLKKEKCSKKYGQLLDGFLINHILMGLEKINKYDFQIQKYCFPFPEDIQNKKIVIYGAGRVGKDYYSQFCRYTDCEVVAWVDKYPDKYDYLYITVSGVSALFEIEYDFIVVAVKSELDFFNIRNYLTEKGIIKDKLIWKKPTLMV